MPYVFLQATGTVAGLSSREPTRTSAKLEEKCLCPSLAEHPWTEVQPGEK